MFCQFEDWEILILLASSFSFLLLYYFFFFLSFPSENSHATHEIYPMDWSQCNLVQKKKLDERAEDLNAMPGLALCKNGQIM